MTDGEFVARLIQQYGLTVGPTKIDPDIWFVRCWDGREWEIQGTMSHAVQEAVRYALNAPYRPKPNQAVDGMEYDEFRRRVLK